MSIYTTGELAKLCNVSVRTVQYYDTRNILVPSQLSDGGRRLYSEEDLKRMRVICFLREMGFSIENIGELFREENPEKLIYMLIEQQEQILTLDIQQQREKLEKLNEVKHGLKSTEKISINTLGDIARIVKSQKKRKRLLWFMLALGIVMDIIEVGVIIYGVKTGEWWPVIVGAPIVIALGIFISCYYFNRIAFICPECHEEFKPKFSKVFWAAHTPNTRRLTCTHCGHKGFCVEVYSEAKKQN